MQVYRPLYEESYAYRNGELFDLRPLHMFFQPAKWTGKEVPRFTRISDPDVIARRPAPRLSNEPHVTGPGIGGSGMDFRRRTGFCWPV